MGDELLQRAIQVLTALRTLSEVPAHTYDREQSSHTAESTVLVKFTTAGDLAPAEPSLFEYHRGQINASNTADELELRILVAEEALRGARKRSGAVTQRMTPEDMREHVRGLYGLGLSAVEIAYREDLPIKWVQVVIRQKPKDRSD
jgi:hypothetical protein